MTALTLKANQFLRVSTVTSNAATPTGSSTSSLSDSAPVATTLGTNEASYPPPSKYIFDENVEYEA